MDRCSYKGDKRKQGRLRPLSPLLVPAEQSAKAALQKTTPKIATLLCDFVRENAKYVTHPQ
jgi:hypothetical protein